MESNMRKIMEQSWREWHGGNMRRDCIPSSVTRDSFDQGFEYCHDILMPLLIEAMPHVYASAGAAHLTDGFKPQRKKIDDLVERIEAVMP